MKEKEKKSQKNIEKPRVLVFGTYDLLHKGHEYHLRKASKYGQLYVVVARDSTVHEMKRKISVHNEKERLENIKKLNFVYKAVLGNKKDRYKCIEQIKPDIICLGYDQVHFVNGLKTYIKEKKLKIRIIHFRKAHFPEKYKTSIIRENIRERA
jgi:FAD synthetase